MENEKEYNGWTNYETWLVALWIDNVQATQEAAQTICAGKYKYNFLKDDALKGFVEDLVCLDEASLRSDLIGAALSEVNWTEIVNNMGDEESDSQNTS